MPSNTSTPTKILAFNGNEPEPSPRKSCSFAIRNLTSRLSSHAFDGPQPAQVDQPVHTVVPGMSVQTFLSPDSFHILLRKRLHLFSMKATSPTINFPVCPTYLHGRLNMDISVFARCSNSDRDMYKLRLDRLLGLLDAEIQQDIKRFAETMESVNRAVIEEEATLKETMQNDKLIKTALLKFIDSTANSVQKDYEGLWDAMTCLVHFKAYRTAFLGFLQNRDKVRLCTEDVINYGRKWNDVNLKEGCIVTASTLKLVAAAKIKKVLPETDASQSLQDILKEAAEYSSKGIAKMPLFGSCYLDTTIKSYPHLTAAEDRLVHQLIVRPFNDVLKEYSSKYEAMVRSGKCHGEEYERVKTGDSLLTKMKAMFLSEEDLTAASPLFVLNERLVIIRALCIARRTPYFHLNKTGWELTKTLEMVKERNSGRVKKVYKVHGVCLMIPLK